VENDPHARFRAFFETHYEAVLAYMLRRVAAAEDLTAEAFLVAWRRFGSVPDDPLPWLMTVARNLIWNHYRGTARREVPVSRLQGEATPIHSHPGEQIADRGEILDAFGHLSARDQETLALVAWEDLSAERAAKVAGCSVGASWVRLHRARRRLAREFHDVASKPSPDASIVLPEMETEQR
jgi:RNA polymerase sigma-70 factor, ECF subfamily